MRTRLMGGAVLLAALSLAAGWQEWQIVRLRREAGEQRSRLNAAESAQTLLMTKLEADDRALRQAVAEAGRARLATALARADRAEQARALDQLRGLLAERARTVADAREAARLYHIRDGSREMQLAVAQATADLDAEIARRAGSSSELELGAGEAPMLADTPLPSFYGPPTTLPESPAPAWAPPAAPPAAITFVSAPTTVLAAPPAEAAPDAGYLPDYFGGFGVSTLGGRRGRSAATASRTRPALAAKYFAASAGIPLTGTPLGKMVGTSPLLLLHQRQTGTP